MTVPKKYREQKTPFLLRKRFFFKKRKKCCWRWKISPLCVFYIFLFLKKRFPFMARKTCLMTRKCFFYLMMHREDNRGKSRILLWKGAVQSSWNGHQIETNSELAVAYSGIRRMAWGQCPYSKVWLCFWREKKVCHKDANFKDCLKGCKL